ncbi:MAG TPA: DUF305 domain-containing protein [Candidatus Paceibacterota bacterium]
MDTKSLGIGVVIGIILGITISPVVLGNSRYGGMMGSKNTSVGNNIDQHFIEQMIPHHDDAIVMANIALTKAEHQEIKTLSQNIITSQSAEIAEMKEWYKNWFGKNVPDVSGMTMGHDMHGGNNMMGMGMMGNETDTEAVKNAKPFDKAFIEEMIPHHQMAVMMAQMLLRTTDRSEMKKLAEDIISAQTKEINQMREWYKTWYSR